MSGQVEAYLGSMLSAHADLKDLLEEMKTLYEKRVRELESMQQDFEQVLSLPPSKSCLCLPCLVCCARGATHGFGKPCRTQSDAVRPS